MRLVPLYLLLLLAACAAPKPAPGPETAPLTPGVVPLTLEQDIELSR